MFTPRHIQAYFQLGTRRSPLLTLELARTPVELARGLMHRGHLAAHSGMLFVYPEPGLPGFWMKNTYIPLDIAWLDNAAHVVDRARMEPHDEQMHRPMVPARYAVELPAGSLDRYGVKIGDRLVRVGG